MSLATVHSLHIYPVKSMQGIELDAVELDDNGLRYDRRWMMVDDQGSFLTQRAIPAMARIQTQMKDDELVLRFDEVGHIAVPLESKQNRISRVQVWDDGCVAIDEGQDVASFLSDCFARPCRLVRMPSQSTRTLSNKYSALVERDASMHFGDSQPIHLVNRASWMALNAELDQSVPIDRFRANIVVDGLDAWMEDSATEWTIGEERMVQTKATSRCVVTTIDQQSGALSQEPLRTLARTRSKNNRVEFGIYLLHEKVGGLLRKGDAVTMCTHS